MGAVAILPIWQQQCPVKLVSKYSTACLLNSKAIQSIQQRLVRHQLSVRDKLSYVLYDIIKYDIILHVI
jgi:hypothetical protein